MLLKSLKSNVFQMDLGFLVTIIELLSSSIVPNCYKHYHAKFYIYRTILKCCKQMLMVIKLGDWWRLASRKGKNTKCKTLRKKVIKKQYILDKDLVSKNRLTFFSYLLFSCLPPLYTKKNKLDANMYICWVASNVHFRDARY